MKIAIEKVKGRKSLRRLKICIICGRTIKRKATNRSCPKCGADPEKFKYLGS